MEGVRSGWISEGIYFEGKVSGICWRDVWRKKGVKDDVGGFCLSIWKGGVVVNWGEKDSSKSYFEEMEEILRIEF